MAQGLNSHLLHLLHWQILYHYATWEAYLFLQKYKIKVVTNIMLGTSFIKINIIMLHKN